MTQRCVSDEQIGRMHRRADDLIRRVIEGTISFNPTMDALQAIIEGKHDSVKQPEAQMQVCEVFSGCRCTICGSYFGDSAHDTVCQQGHHIGGSYPVRV